MNLLKGIFCRLLVLLHTDSLFRFFNRNKLLVITYHGISQSRFNPPFWTQLPEETFLEQIKYLNAHYNIISLNELTSCLENGANLPQRAALITFDDGLRNNYTVAFPILVKFGISAAIFLTMDFVGTEHIFWFDELYLLLKQASHEKIPVSNIGGIFSSLGVTQNFTDTYNYVVEQMKRITDQQRLAVLKSLRERIPLDQNCIPEDFKMLDWEQIMEMERTGLIDFGVHTANHRILAGLSEDDFNKEIAEPKERLSKKFNRKVASFCYPNGRPGLDYSDVHIQFLCSCGYICAFTTKSVLNAKGMDPYQIGRISVGNDFTSDPNYFRLRTSGFFLRRNRKC